MRRSLPPHAIEPFVDTLKQWLRSVATEKFSIEAVVRGYHAYQDSWDVQLSMNGYLHVTAKIPSLWHAVARSRHRVIPSVM